MIQQTSLNSFTELPEIYLSEQQSKVYEAIKVLVECTDREIADYLNEFDPNKIRPRRFELCELGLVGESNKRKCRISGKTAITWNVTK
jgi:hypothetical protein